MTDREKILAKCKAESGVGDEAEMRGLRYENARLTPIIRALLTDRERLIAALNIFKEIGDMGPEDTVMTFVEDPSVIEYAAQAIAQSAQTTREILNEEKT